MQRAYFDDRRKAFSAICGGRSEACRIPVAAVEAHFTRVHAASVHAPGPAPLAPPPLPPLDDADPFDSPFTPGEVWERLARCSDTAPGADGLRYSEWKRADPGGHILAALFNAIHRLRMMPRAWTESTTTLLHKKGDPDDISNWRPIGLLPTIAKVYHACLAKRLTAWAVRHSRLSLAQKGFLAYRGPADHNFCLQACIQDAGRRRRGVAVAFLDLRNAFGSVPHATLSASLDWLGLDPVAVRILERCFQSNTTQVRTAGGLTRPIPVESGVVQGSPLSPVLFNLALEMAIRMGEQAHPGYPLFGHDVGVLAYADDLACVSQTPAGLQKILDAITQAADWAGLTFNQRKCASLSLHARKVTGDVFSVQGSPIPALTEDEPYAHLGVPTGAKVFPSAEKALETMTTQLDAVHDSLLKPWQKVDALQTFILSQLPFHLQHGHVPKGPLVVFDKLVKRRVKSWLSLPQRASVEPLYMSPAHGGLGLLPTSLLADISCVAHAATILHSLDGAVAEIAHRSAHAVAAARAKRPVTAPELAQYLSGSLHAPFDTYTVDCPSLWTKARAATRRLAATLPVAWLATVDGALLPTLGGSPLCPATCQRRLTMAARGQFLRKLLSKRDQGKTFHCIAQSPVGSHFVRYGRHLSFADWRFIWRARLDVLPVNAALRWMPNADKRCRRCGHGLETLPHVLSHCPPSLVAITERHDRVVERIVAACKPGP